MWPVLVRKCLIFLITKYLIITNSKLLHWNVLIGVSKIPLVVVKHNFITQEQVWFWSKVCSIGSTNNKEDFVILMKSLFSRKRYFVSARFGLISMKSLFNTSCDKDLVDFRQFWLLKQTFWQNSYRIFRFWYCYTLFRYEIGKIVHLISHQVSWDLLKETSGAICITSDFSHKVKNMVFSA